MCPEQKRSQGFALPAAIFLMVTIALMVAAMVRMVAGQNLEQASSLLATQANWAAQSGLEWAAYEVKSQTPGDCFTNTTLNLAGFDVAVTCTVTGYAEGSVSNNRFRYQIVAIAASTGMTVNEPDYVYREQRATMLIRN